MPIVISKKAQELAVKIGLAEGPTVDLLDLSYIECGLHSGIPPCCILFFVLVWMRWVCGENFQAADAYQAAEAALGLDSAGYVLCPACMLAKKPVKLKKCNCKKQRSICLEQSQLELISMPWLQGDEPDERGEAAA